METGELNSIVVSLIPLTRPLAKFLTSSMFTDFYHDTLILTTYREANVEGAFAMMAVVLPSEHDAGDVCLSYGRSQKTFRCCSSSQCDTAVITWFNGVKYEMAPLTSGYRLELLYALVHTTDLPKPALPEDDRLAEQFRKDLIRWNDSRGSPHALEKILYLLSSVYPSGTLKSSCLKGSDTIIAGVLEKEATQLGFCLGFAEISGQKGGDSLTVSNLVDFNGRHLSAELDFTLENTETIPRNLVQRIGSRGVAKIEGGNYQGKVAFVFGYSRAVFHDTLQPLNVVSSWSGPRGTTSTSFTMANAAFEGPVRRSQLRVDLKFQLRIRPFPALS